MTAKHTKTAKINIPMCIASVLLCLTLISIHLTGGLYAKYITSSSAEDSARVITFGDITITESGSFDGTAATKGMIIPGVNLQKKAVVDFAGSESAVYVFVEVILSEHWTTTDNFLFSYKVNDSTGAPFMTWAIENGWTFLKKAEAANTYVYYRTLAPNTELKAVDIIADDGAIAVSEYITKSEITSMTEISVKLRASVVQSGGFDDADAAWTSIAAKEGSAN